MSATVRLWDKDFNLLSTHEAEAEVTFTVDGNTFGGMIPRHSVRATWESDGTHFIATQEAAC